MKFWVLLILGVIYLAYKIFFFLSDTLRRKKMKMGIEKLLGAIVTAKTEINPKGVVFYLGEDWTAESTGEAIKAGEKVKVVGFEGLRLKVERVKESEG